MNTRWCLDLFNVSPQVKSKPIGKDAGSIDYYSLLERNIIALIFFSFELAHTGLDFSICCFCCRSLYSVSHMTVQVGPHSTGHLGCMSGKAGVQEERGRKKRRPGTRPVRCSSLSLPTKSSGKLWLDMMYERGIKK